MSERQKKAKLPFSFWWPIGIGALAGVGLRLVFSGRPGEAFSAMTGTFIFVAPIVAGAVTVYLADKERIRSWRYCASAGALANLALVLGTMLILIEGLICAVIILPLFMLLGALGGLMMGLVHRGTNWRGPMVCSIGVAPFLLGMIEGNSLPPDQFETVERTVYVDVPPAKVWNSILEAPNISPADLPDAWLYRIGVPLPMSGSTRNTAEGPIRRVTMGKDIYFDEVFTHSIPYEHLRWTYRFYDNSFPRYALDEHVVIGGHYFDVIDTSYALESTDAGTQLTIELTYRISTQFNWYAGPVARFLLSNLAESNLGYYKIRSEASE